jgi:putative hemolysin
MWGVELVVMLGMVAVNSVFAGYEIALAAVSLSRLHALVRDNRAGAKAALFMKENLEGSLAAVQLGITLVGAIAAATGGAGAAGQIAPSLQQALGLSSGAAELLALTVVVVPLTAVTIIFGELAPKVFALRNKEWVCLRLSPGARWFTLSVWPVVWLLEAAVTALMRLGERHWKARLDRQATTDAADLQELRATVALARTSRLIGPQEEKIILGATGLSQRPVREIMLPAGGINMLDADAPVGDSLVAAHLDMHTRFPVSDRAGDPQAIIGFVNFKDIVALMRLSARQPATRAVVRPIPSFPADTPIALCLERLIRDHTHIALVRGDDGRVVGMVTLEDIIEELVGDIEDEYDHLPAHAVPTGAGWVVGGGIDLNRLRELTGLDLTVDKPRTEARHLSEWVIGHLQRPVRGGEVLERGDVRVVVRKVRRNRVLEAQVQRGVNQPGSSHNRTGTAGVTQPRAS